ncbi:response regulator transcription factor [Trinickia fusca]|uniref:DNA-binding response regulator n=1 Tax=Trinickia fusca TaxID=2419777 RepID=A0A494XBF2_9BURK|nr:response regulator transcription factor [Trinickia fusca]RKP48157.1 DNA-binding response regulator [Trinickia fusca]
MTNHQILLMSRPKHRIRVALLDDHPVVAFSISSYFRGATDLEIVASTSTADELFDVVGRGACDAALVDFHMPNDRLDGASFVKRLRLHAPSLAIIVFSAAPANDFESVCYRAGANAFVEKSVDLSMIAEAVRRSMSSPKDFLVVRNGAVQAAEPWVDDERLSPNEMEVLRHMATGLTVTQTADRLNRSRRTISTHKRSAMRKLHLPDDLSLALFLKERFGRQAGSRRWS